MTTLLGFLDKIIGGADQILAPINKRLGTIAYIIIGLMVLPIVGDVSMRFLFHRSILGVIEIQEFGLVVVTFLVLSRIENEGQNIRIDLLIRRYPIWAQNFVNNINYLLMSILFLLATWHTLLTAIKKSHVRSDSFEVPVTIFIVIAALGLFLLSVTLVKKFLSTTAELIKERKTPLLLISFIIGLAFALLPYYVKHISHGMSGLGLGAVAILFLLMLLMVLGTPLAFSMFLVGYVGLFIVRKNSLAVFGMLGSVPYSQTANFFLVVLPMFMMMGSLVYYSGISKDLFDAAQKWLGRVPGGLAVSSVAGCAGFAAVSGDSMATAVTMGTVAFPAMKKNGYDASIATGCLAAGGTLGILIPPSLGFIVYAIITEESVGRLFLAGMIPGVLLSLLFIGCIYILARLKPQLFPPGEHYSLRERVHSLKGIWAVLVLFVLILGGILGGIFSPNSLIALDIPLARFAISVLSVKGETIVSIARVVYSSNRLGIFSGDHCLGGFGVSTIGESLWSMSEITKSLTPSFNA